jgi:hypothetical protein
MNVFNLKTDPASRAAPQSSFEEADFVIEEQGNALLCMLNRTKCILFNSVLTVFNLKTDPASRAAPQSSLEEADLGPGDFLP